MSPRSISYALIKLDMIQLDDLVKERYVMNEMTRSLERKVIYVASSWQIITGLITIFFYSNYIKKLGLQMDNPTEIQVLGMEGIFSSFSTFAVSFGIFFVFIGVLNIFFAKMVMKDHTVQKGLPIFWLVLVIVFYFLSDYISLLLTLVSAIIALSKNKAIAQSETEGQV